MRNYYFSQKIIEQQLIKKYSLYFSQPTAYPYHMLYSVCYNFLENYIYQNIKYDFFNPIDIPFVFPDRTNKIQDTNQQKDLALLISLFNKEKSAYFGTFGLDTLLKLIIKNRPLFSDNFSMETLYLRALEAVTYQLSAPMEENAKAFIHAYQNGFKISSPNPYDEILLNGIYLNSSSSPDIRAMKTADLLFLKHYTSAPSSNQDLDMYNVFWDKTIPIVIYDVFLNTYKRYCKTPMSYYQYIDKHLSTFNTLNPTDLSDLKRQMANKLKLFTERTFISKDTLLAESDFPFLDCAFIAQSFRTPRSDDELNRIQQTVTKEIMTHCFAQILTTTNATNCTIDDFSSAIRDYAKILSHSSQKTIDISFVRSINLACEYLYTNSVHSYHCLCYPFFREWDYYAYITSHSKSKNSSKLPFLLELKAFSSPSIRKYLFRHSEFYYAFQNNPDLLSALSSQVSAVQAALDNFMAHLVTTCTDDDKPMLYNELMAFLKNMALYHPIQIPKIPPARSKFLQDIFRLENEFSTK